MEFIFVLFFSMVLLLFFGLIIVAPFVLLIIALSNTSLGVNSKKYYASEYYANTGISISELRRSSGCYGEYLLYDYLKGFKVSGVEFVFNAYIPDDKGGTTEVDLIMISPKGIFVFESKNYGGWIFGSEDRSDWYQVLKSGRYTRKNKFFNPVMQNNHHIRCIKNFLNISDGIPVWSVVVFSERCTLKNVSVSAPTALVKRRDVVLAVQHICEQLPTINIDGITISDIYNKLYPCSKVSEDVKMAHIANIQH